MAINLRELFKDRVSSSAFQVVDGELRIIGKFGQLSTIGDKFDIWFIGPGTDPLGAHKMTAIAKKLPENAGLVRLDGEAYYQTRDIRLVDKTLPLLGVKKKRRYSDEYKEKLRERLR